MIERDIKTPNRDSIYAPRLYRRPVTSTPRRRGEKLPQKSEGSPPLKNNDRSPQIWQWKPFKKWQKHGKCGRSHRNMTHIGVIGQLAGQDCILREWVPQVPVAFHLSDPFRLRAMIEWGRRRNFRLSRRTANWRFFVQGFSPRPWPAGATNGRQLIFLAPKHLHGRVAPDDDVLHEALSTSAKSFSVLADGRHKPISCRPRVA